MTLAQLHDLGLDYQRETTDDQASSVIQVRRIAPGYGHLDNAGLSQWAPLTQAPGFPTKEIQQ